MRFIFPFFFRKYPLNGGATLTKVKILPNVKNFNVDRIQYKPGDIIDIPPSLFSAGFMMEIVETPKVELVKPAAEEYPSQKQMEDSEPKPRPARHKYAET